MRKILFSLLVVATAVGMSSYVNAEKPKRFDSFYYILTTTGTYVKTTDIPSEENCRNAVAHVCWIEYSVDKGDNFASNAAPTADKVAESSTNGLYVP